MTIGKSAPPIPYAGFDLGHEIPLTGNPTLWYFPTGLIAEARVNHTTPFELMTCSLATSADMTITAVSHYDWATQFDIQVRRITSNDPNTPLDFLPHSYVLLGTSQASRTTIRALWQHLHNHADSEHGSIIYPLYPANADSNNPDGFVTDTIDGPNTFLLKTNLATQTTSDQHLQRVALQEMVGAGETRPLSPFAAPINQPEPFLKLLWEGSIVTTGGYYLNYITREGLPLPDTLFTDGDTITLRFVVLLNSQSKTADPVRTFYPFNNCAIAQDNIDSLSGINLFAQAADGSHTTKIATLPPGNIGFELQRPNPEFEDEDEQATRTRTLYNLLGFKVVENNIFTPSYEALPVGPVIQDETPESETIWTYQQTIPTARFVINPSAPKNPALPAPNQDPYSGLGQQLQLQLGFQDFIGNRLDETSPYQLDCPLTYTDSIIGLSEWPGLTASYNLADVGGNPTVAIDLAFQLANYVPSFDLPFTTALFSASAHLTQYRQVYYQLQDQRIAFTLQTSLNQTDFESSPNPYHLPASTLLTLVQAIYTHVHTLTWHMRELTGTGKTLAAVAQQYGHTTAAIARANQTRAIAEIFSNTVKIPHYHRAAANERLARVSEQVGVSVAQLAEQNSTTRLTPNVLITTPRPSYTTPSLDQPSLQQIADSQQTTPQAIANTNRADTTILQPGFVFRYDNLSVTVVSGDSFDTILQQFRENLNLTVTINRGLDVTLDDIVVPNVDQPAMFQRDAHIGMAHYLIQPLDTLHKIANQFDTTVDTLADDNRLVADLILAGTPLLLGEQEAMAPNHTYTLLMIAQTYEITVAQLAEFNGTTALNTTADLIIPNLVTLAEVNSAHAPYITLPEDTLTVVATKFNENMVDSLATTNQAMSAIFVAGQSVTVNDTTLLTTDRDSLDSLTGRFQTADPAITFAQVAVACKEATLQTATYLAASLPRTSSNQSLANLAQLYNSTVPDLAIANSSLDRFLAANFTVTIKGTPLTTGAHETLNTLVTRFALEEELLTTVIEIANSYQNDPNFINNDIIFILPPPNMTLSVGLGANYAQSPTFPAPIFPLAMDLVMARDESLVAPEFADETAVYRNTTTIPPLADAVETDERDKPLSLQSFATNFEATFSDIKVASSQHKEDGRKVQDIWLVNFGPTGISQIDLQNAPTYFGLRPLANRLLDKSSPIREFDPETASFQTTQQNAPSKLSISKIGHSHSWPW